VANTDGLAPGQNACRSTDPVRRMAAVTLTSTGSPRWVLLLAQVVSWTRRACSVSAESELDGGGHCRPEGRAGHGVAVLLQAGVERNGITFFTNYDSAKRARSWAGHRPVRVFGDVSVVPAPGRQAARGVWPGDSRSLQRRTRTINWSAPPAVRSWALWASQPRQRKTRLPSRAALLEQLSDVTNSSPISTRVPVPPTGAIPHRAGGVEFLVQGREDRCTPNSRAKGSIERLQP